MSFQPVVPMGGYAGWKFLQRTMASQQASFDKAPALQNDTAYFRAHIAKVTTADQLIGDRRLLKVALGAFGLGSAIDGKALIRKVLTDGTQGRTALANRLSDKRYLSLAQAFDFGDGGPPNTQGKGFADKIVSAYQNQEFATAVGQQDKDMGLVLGLHRNLGTLAAGGATEVTKWYTVMGSPSLRQVFETALGLPSTFASVPIDTQLTQFQARSEATFGANTVSQFSDPAQMDKLAKLYLLRAQIRDGGASGGGSRSAALQLLQGGQADPAAGLLSILSG